MKCNFESRWPEEMWPYRMVMRHYRTRQHVTDICYPWRRFVRYVVPPPLSSKRYHPHGNTAKLSNAGNPRKIAALAGVKFNGNFPSRVRAPRLSTSSQLI